MAIARIYLLFLASCFCLQASAWADSTVDKATELQALYRSAMADENDSTAAAAFFFAFPNSFEAFNTVYGFDDGRAAPLYEDAFDHLQFFNGLSSAVGDTVYSNKVISIAIAGRRDADAVNYFRDGLIKNLRRNTGLFVSLLQNRTEAEAYSFWVFYFDSPHPGDVIEKPLLAIRTQDKGIYKLLLKAHQYVQDDWAYNH